MDKVTVVEPPGVTVEGFVRSERDQRRHTCAFCLWPCDALANLGLCQQQDAGPQPWVRFLSQNQISSKVTQP